MHAPAMDNAVPTICARAIETGKAPTVHCVSISCFKFIHSSNRNSFISFVSFGRHVSVWKSTCRHSQR